MTERTAAQSLYPHLPSGERPQRAQTGPSIGDAMWPSLKRATWDERWWENWRKKDRESLLRNLREAVAEIRAEKAGRR
jgi:hypothetical protein